MQLLTHWFLNNHSRALKQHSVDSVHLKLHCHSSKLVSAHNCTPYQTGLGTRGGWDLSQTGPCGPITEVDNKVGDVPAPSVGQADREVESGVTDSGDYQ